LLFLDILCLHCFFEVQLVKALLLNELLDFSIQAHHLIDIVTEINVLHFQLNVFEAFFNLFNKLLFGCAQGYIPDN
jgi:hypothetical protein